MCFCVFLLVCISLFVGGRTQNFANITAPLQHPYFFAHVNICDLC